MGRRQPGDVIEVFPPEDDKDALIAKYDVMLGESEGYWELFKAQIVGNPGIGVIALNVAGKSRWVHHPDNDDSGTEEWKDGTTPE